MTWQCISPEVTVEGLKKCCVSIAMDGTDDDMLWNGSDDDDDRNFRTVRKIKAWLKMQTVIVFGKGR